MLVVKGGNRTLVSDDKKKSGRKPSGKARGRGGGKRKSRMAIYGAAGNQLTRDVKWLLSVVNVEDKYLDISSSTVTAGTWTYVLLNPLSQGVTPNTRIGQSVKCVGLEVRCTVFCNSASTAFQTVRFMVFKDKQANGALPGATDVYGSGVLTPRTVGYISRFTILFERTMCFSPTSSDGINSFDFITRQDWHQEFNTGNSGTITDITENSCYVGYITDQGALFPNVSFTSRYVYVDN